MSISKDWMMEAAEDLRNTLTWWSWKDWKPANIPQAQTVIRSIIARYCPFKPDVAYMPVPSCETCEHWERLTLDRRGDCSRLRTVTWIDDGCVQWKEK